MAETITELLDPPSADQLKTDLLEQVARPEIPTTDWNPGGVLRTIIAVEALVLDSLVGRAFPLQMAGAFADSATSPNVSPDWLPLIAHGFYDLDAIAATVATQSVTLASAAGNPTFTISVGAFVLVATDGKRYIATSGGSLVGGGTLSITVAGEGPGLARGLVSTLETFLPRVTIQ